jgi:hypothetical protein
MVGKSFQVTAEEGQLLLGLTLQFSCPEKLGAKTFSPIQRMSINRDVMALYDAIRKVSPLLQRRDRKGGRMFGPESNWDLRREDNGDITTGDIVRNDLAVEVELSARARDGAAWVIVFACHPESKLPQAGISLQNDVLLPLAAKLKRRKAVDEELEVYREKVRDWSDDIEPSAVPEKS